MVVEGYGKDVLILLINKGTVSKLRKFCNAVGLQIYASEFFP
jgi:hypothetical protein